MKFLVVEDDKLSSELLRLHLNEYGTSYEASDGTIAIEVVKNALNEGWHFDVIFMDIMMPGMDGHETLQAIRVAEKEHDIPPEKATKVIMVSAMGDAGNITCAFQEGCDGYIIKPVQESNLEKEMNKLGFSKEATV